MFRISHACEMRNAKHFAMTPKLEPIIRQPKKIKQYPSRSQFKNFVLNLQNPEEIYKNWAIVQNFLNLDKEIKFLKTHHINCEIGKFKFTDDKNTLGAIHIVRDPRNVLLSVKNHFSLNNYTETLEFISREKHWIGIEKKESDRLLKEIFEHQSRLDLTCRFSWTTNTVAIWDNRSVIHYAIADFYPGKGLGYERVMDRIAIEGDSPQ